MEEITDNGVRFKWYLAGPQGAAFLLFPDLHHTQEDIQQAKAEIRHKRDAVSIRIADDYDRDEEYRSKIFADPRTKPLMWYEINADDRKLIRASRKAGMTPADYVSRHVLPCIRQTSEANNVKGARRFDVEEYIRLFGELGSLPRLNVIACLGLGARSEAAKRAIAKREARMQTNV